MENYNNKIKFTLIYNNKNSTIFFPRNKLINCLYFEVGKIFNLKKRYRLFYKNKDLTPFLDLTFEKYFNNISHVNILIKDSFINKNKKISFFIPFNDTKYLNKENNENNLKKNNNNEYYYYYNFLCENCQKEKIKCFCRDCCYFICNKCRNNKNSKHFCHKVINLYLENLLKSCELYKQIVSNDLIEVKNSKRENKKIEIFDVDLNQNNLNKKISFLLNKVKTIKLNLINLNEIEKNKEKNLNIIKENINILENLEEKNKNLIDEFDEFNKIDNKLNDIKLLPEQLNKYELINEMLENLLNKILKQIFKILFKVFDEKNNINEYKTIVSSIDNYFKKNNFILKNYKNNNNNSNQILNNIEENNEKKE